MKPDELVCELIREIHNLINERFEIHQIAGNYLFMKNREDGSYLSIRIEVLSEGHYKTIISLLNIKEVKMEEAEYHEINFWEWECPKCKHTTEEKDDPGEMETISCPECRSEFTPVPDLTEWR